MIPALRNTSKKHIIARDKLSKIIEDDPAYNGVGIGLHPNGKDLSLSVLMDPDKVPKKALPPEIDGYLVITTACGPIKLLQEQTA